MSSDKIPRVSPYSGSLSLHSAVSTTGLSPSLVHLSNDSSTATHSLLEVLNPVFLRFGLLPVRSPLLGESISLSFPLGTEMFHFPRLPSH